jgi:amino acid adenylation domain-containing protein/non-ribosomal peptide synthase protein (TIGR01720 family)
MAKHFIEGIIHKATEGGVDFLLEGDKLTLKILQDREIDNSLLTLIRENKESIKTFLRDNGVFIKAGVNSKITAVKHHDGPMPLSFAQERLWFIDQLHGSLPYHMPWVFNLRGALHKEYLESSFREILQRHEVLRTVIREQDGVGYQVVLPCDAWQLKTINFEHEQQPADQLIRRLINTPFDLSQDFMLKVWLVRISEGEHLLVTVLHHIAFDGWSIGILVNELKALYTSKIENKKPEVKALPIQYADYAFWQREFLTGALLEKKLGYWKQQLQGVTALELPADYARPAIQSTRGAMVSSHVDKDIYGQLLDLSKQEGTTLFMTLCAAFNVLLYKYTGQHDICIGTAAAGRQQQELEGLIGFFVNTLALRNKLDERSLFKDFLQQVRQTTLEAYKHQEVPFEKIVEVLGMQRDMSRTPVFQVMFALQNMPQAEGLQLGDVQLLLKRDSRLSARFDLELEITESADGLQLSVTYCRDLFNEATVKQLLAHYECLLQSILFEPAAAIGELNILTAKDLHQVLYDFNETAAAYPKDKTVVHFFEEQALRTPGAVAAVFEDEQLSYRQLNERANQLAHFLQGKGVQQETLVPICLDRSLDMLVAVFAIWKAGAAYVPIDPSHPASRISYMLEDCKATIAICHKAYESFFTNTELVILDETIATLAEQPVTNVSDSASSGLSYLIYTSGSTGQPKGVMIEHRSLLNFLLGMQSQLQLSELDSTIAITTYSFDISCLELYLSLISGGTVHIASQWQVKDGYALRALVEKVKPTYMQATPSGWQLLLESGWRNDDDTRLLTGGEAISNALKETLTGISSDVFNMYGPTETTIWSAMHKLQQGQKVSIGRPVANTNIYILNSSLQPCPAGVYGELCIGGDGLSRGYLNKEALTREKFIGNPFVKGERIYRTGDIARWNPDGTLEYLGRKDEQVKVRGYRIELGEIETVLNRAPGIKQGVVVAAQDNTGGKQLVAYVVKLEGYDKQTVIGHLRLHLPEYMIPALFAEIEKLPLTPNGKVDRKKLREQELNLTSAAYEAPGNETEQTLAATWQELLSIDKISIHDNFFELGGHSLLAMRMVSMIRKQLCREVSIREVFLHPTIRQLAARVIANNNQQVVAGILRYERSARIPLSFSQERLWFIHQLQGSLSYHMPYVFRLKGALNADALEASFREIINRHEVLRTVIRDEDGKGYQFITPAESWKLHRTTQQKLAAQYGSVQDFIGTTIQTPFDLAAGPMFKIWLIEVSANEHILFAMLHHIVFDGWSVGIMVEELVELYRSKIEQRPAALKALPVQYADYATWQRNYLPAEVLEQKLSYWKNQLRDVTPIEVPTDHARPAVQSTRGALFTHVVEKNVLDGLHSLSQQEGATLFMTLLSTFNVLLYRYCGEGDICVGSAVAGRNQQEVEGLVGFFINTIALRNNVNGKQSFAQFLQQVKQTTLDAYEHQDVPFEKVVEALDIERDLSRTPLFQSMFTLQNAPHSATLKLGDVMLAEERAGTVTSRFDLGFSLTESAKGLEVTVNYCRDLYNEDTIARLLHHYDRLLQAVLTHRHEAIDRLPMLEASEITHLLEVFGSSSVSYPRGNKTIVDLFEEQARKTPDNMAVVFEGEQLTYRQLDEYSNRLAHYLVDKGVSCEDLVVISVKRSLECIAGMLGIIKAGAAYVPVDNNYPDERIAYILKDTACKVCLGDSQLKERLPAILPGNNIRFIALKGDAASITAASAERINLSDTRQLVYIIYTSGSTGLPKGVMIEHAHLVDHVYGMFRSARINTCASFALFASLVADAGHSIVFSSLITGGALHVLSDEVLMDGEQVSAYIARHRIDCIKIVPSLWLSYLESSSIPLPGKVLIFGGEAFALNILDILRQLDYKGALYNHYGPTEATIGKCIHKIDLNRNYQCVPIGRPFSNTKAYIVDGSGQLCPMGVSGELYLGGEGIARGYLNRPELSKQRFIEDPFNKGGRVYKTGDVCRWLADGNIEYMGRKDDQVKIRGYRIELGEIESVLQQVPGVAQAVVMLSEDGKRLIGCIVAQAAPGKEKIDAYLRSKLPDYMVPAVITQVDAIPLTANGKLDRKKLQQLSAAALSFDKEYTAPRNEVEQALAGVWAALLGLEKVSIHDNFFELGGDSIITIQVVSRVRRKGYELQPKDLFMHQTIARLSAIIIERGSAATAIYSEQGMLEGPSGLLPIQQWFFENAPREISHFNQAMLVEIDKRISAGALQSAVKILTQWHDALRFTYRHTASGWIQEYGTVEGSLAVEELKTVSVITSLANNYQRGLNIEKGELVKAVLFKTPATETNNRLLIVIHHLAIDGVSWRILLNDLAQLFAAHEEGKPLPAGIKGSSYRQWHEALVSYSKSNELKSQLPYWVDVASRFVALPADKQHTGVVTRQDFDTAEGCLSPELTRQLLQEVNKAYRTNINDILLAALAKTFAGWTHGSHITIGLEGHGREAIAANLDVSRTVGWFTSIYPVVLTVPAACTDDELLKCTKEQLRRIPGKGLGYGVLKYINKEASLQHTMPWEVVFNYLGQADNVVSSDLFTAAKESAGEEVAACMAQHNKMEIVSIIEDGSLKISWKYSTKHYEQQTISALIAGYINSIQQLVAHCRQQAAKGAVFTPSDFGLEKEVTCKELDDFIAANPPVESVYRLSALQQGMLFHGLYDKGSSAYIEQFCCELSRLNLDAFTKSWEALVRRHTILRTGFHHDAFSIPVQCVYEQVSLNISVLDYRGMNAADQQAAVAAFSNADRARGFDFTHAPLMRIALLQLETDRYAMVWTFHHILFDGWSMPVLMEEFLTCYEQLLQEKSLPQAEPDRYEDYIRYLETRDKEKEAHYWKNYLDKAGQGSLLPFISTSADRLKGIGSYREELLELGATLTSQVEAFAREHRVTVNTIMQAVWAYLLYRYTGNSDVVYGVTVSGRPDNLPGVEQRIGMYINSIPLRSLVHDRPLVEWLQAIQQDQLASREFQFSAITDIQEWTGLKAPFFDTMLVFENYPISRLLSAKQWQLRVENTSLREHNNYPLSVEITNGPAIGVRFNYNEALLAAGCVQMIAGHFNNVLQQFTNGAVENITEVSLLTEAEENQLLHGFNDTATNYPKHSTVTEQFEQQVKSSPAAIALVFEGQQLSYSALDKQSSRLANYLRGYGVAEESLVAVCMNRSADLIISILAILKAGAAYVPIDPAYPASRISYMLEDINATVLLTHSFIQLPGELTGRCERIDIDKQSFDKFSPVKPVVQLNASSLAYVLYTSGSTGTPKGVQVEHRNIVSLVKGVSFVQLSVKDVVLSTGSPSFDATTIEYWGALLNGGKLVMCSQETLLDTMLLKQVVQEQQVTTMWLTAGWFNEVVETDASLFSTLNTILVGGDKLSPVHISQVKNACPALAVINGYGPTENTTFSLTFTIDKDYHELGQDIPVGYPLANRRAYILDEQYRLCPVGVPGEICVGGDGLSRGYLGQEQLTKQKFINDPFNKGERLYKTGDLGKWAADGSIEYLGRKDDQVKIRGYRIEPGEIENTLHQVAGVQQAVVLATHEGAGSRKLMAYVVASESFDAAEAAGYLQGRLPDYMVPAAIVQVAAMPLTSNGKIDRQKLHELEISLPAGKQYTAPRTETELALATTWSELLEIEQVGVHDNFFELGGHSLLAIRVIAAIRNQFGKEIGIKDLFDRPSISELAVLIDGESNAQSLPAIERLPHRDNIPLSFAQERLWFIDKLHGSVQYHMPWVFKLEGDLDAVALEAAFAEIVRRHEVLRTVINEQDGVGRQAVLPVEQWQLNHLDINGQPMPELIRQLLSTPFDLSADFMLRVWLVKLSAREHLLVTLFHHIAFDGWSIGVMVKELEALYQSKVQGKTAALPALPVQYSDYAAWQRQYLSGAVLESKLDYWKNKLAGVEPLELQPDYARPVIQSMRGAVIKTNIDKELTAQLQQLSQAEGATLFMTLLSAFNILLYKYTGQHDICIGSPIAGRQQQDLEGLIGFFVNTLALRNQVKDESCFSEILQRVKQTTLEAYEQQDLPFEKIVEALGVQRDMSRTPVFQVMFALQNMPLPRELKLGNIPLSAVQDDVVHAKFDLSLSISESPGGLQLELIYCSDLFEAATMQDLLQHYKQLLRRIVNAGNTPVAELSMLSMVEEEQLLQQFSNLVPGMTSYPFALKDALDEQLRTGRSNIAIRYKNRSISYDELQSSIGRMSWFLRKKLRLEKGEKVAVLLNRSEKLVLSILAVLRSGLVYVPIETSYPADRMLYMLRDAQPSLVITDERMDVVASSGCQQITIDEMLAVEDAGSYFEETIAPNDEAYIIYTSGSTGQPKGVVATHGGLDHLFEHVYIQYVHARPVVPFIALHTFDISLFQLLMPIISGGTSLVVDREQLHDPEQLISLLQQSTVIDTVPGLYKMIVNYIEENKLTTSFEHIERVFVGGDSIPDELLYQLGRVFSNATVTISYGPTEGTIFCTCLHHEPASITSAARGAIIGRPFGKTQLYVLGKSMELLPAGVEGEICIGGPGVSKGYLNQPAQTAQKYVVNPFKPGELIYRTGDVARWTRDGIIEFRGRNDNQVKIRGNRIELGELENKLENIEGISAAVVVAAKKRDAEAYLAAFYTGIEITRTQFETHLARFFAESVLPSHYIHLDEIPLTSNGKIDRKKLQDLAAGVTKDGAEYVAPRNEAEQALATVWQDLLQVAAVSIHDNFFELGGDSIITIQVVSRMRRKGFELQPKDIFLYQTIARLSAVITERKAFATVSGEQGLLHGACAMLPVQQWYFENASHNISHFNQSILLGIDKSIESSALEAVVKLLVQQHDALRFMYARTALGWVQEYGASEGRLWIEEITGDDDLIAEETRHLANNYQRCLDIEKGDLCRFVLIKTPSTVTHNRFLIIVHHLAIDGVSWRILLEEMEQLLSQHSAGRPLTPGIKGSSYRQWYQALEQYSNSYRLNAQLPYWENTVNRFEPLPVDSNYEEVVTQRLAAYTVQLSKNDTQQLLQEAPKAYHTEINDLLLAALAKTISKWSRNNQVIIGLEAHGREDIAEGTDLSRTIGWFSSVFPVLLNTGGTEKESELVKSVKEQLRAVPGKGLGYGVLRYISKKPSLQTARPWEIVFNYLGQTGNVISSRFFTAANESAGDNMAEGSVQHNKMEIVSIVEGGQLKVNWRYSARHYRESTIEHLATSFVTNLQLLIQHSVQQLAKGPVHTPADFSLGKEISYQELDAFMQILPAGASIQSMYRLSGLQEGMMFHGLYNASSGAYVEQFCADLVAPDLDIFIKSWNQVLKQHSILRSGFYSDAFSIPVQCVYDGVTVPVSIVDYRSLHSAKQQKAVEAFIAEDRMKGFDFKQVPLMRIALLQLSATRYRMVWSFHHILFDGWSMPVLMEEFLNTYEAYAKQQPLPGPVEDRFEDYIRYIERKDSRQEKEYWQSYLRGLQHGSFLPFIAGAGEPTKAAGVYAEEIMRLDAGATEQLKLYAKKHRLTINTIMQGVWACLLHHYTGNTDVVYGVTVSGRPEDLPGVEKKVGMYVNTLPFYASIDREQNIVSWLQALQQSQLSSRQFQYSSLTNIQEWAGVKGQLFDNILVFENYPVDKMIAARKWALQVENIKALGQTNYPLSIIIETAAEITGCFKYNATILPGFYVKNIVGHFSQALQQLIANDEARLGEVAILTGAERNRLRQLGTMEANYPMEKTMVDLLNEQLTKTPEAIAVVAGEQQLTYAELHERADELACHLQGKAVKPETIVGLCLERGLEMIIGILGILKAGAAYLPIDPDYPADRISFMLNDAGCSIVLTTTAVEAGLRDSLASVAELIAIDQLPVSTGRSLELTTNIKPHNAAYLIYTSGSTGRPKGVINEHGGLVNRLLWAQQYFNLTAQDVILQKTTFCFDVSVWELLWPLIAGSRLVFAKPAGHKDPLYLKNIIAARQVTTMHFVPSMLEVFLQEVQQGECNSLQRVLCSGEALKPSQAMLFRQKFPETGLHNLYGPTEAAIDVTCWSVPQNMEEIATVPIGKPVANTQLYILNAAGHMVPEGVSGELYIAGVQVARGYINRDELNKQKFISDPFSNRAGARMYRTGDLARWLPSLPAESPLQPQDANIEYLGRIDDQVKIRGYRVELGEIESVLQQAPGILQAVVAVHEDERFNKRLVAYVTGEATDKESIMLYLKSKLPDYMLPATLVQLESIPLNANGKTDRKRLPKPEPVGVLASNYQPPRNELEQQLAASWQELLGIERIGIYDNLAELGANSLLVMRLDAFLKKKFQLAIPIQVLFQFSSIDEMSKYVQAELQAGKQEETEFEIVNI